MLSMSILLFDVGVHTISTEIYLYLRSEQVCVK